MFLKKKVMLLLLIVIMLVAVAACGGAAPAPPAESQPAEKPAEQAEEAPAAAEPQEVNLTFWTFVDAHADFFNRQAERFNAEHPEVKITLDPTVIDYQEMHDKLLIAL